MTVLGRVAAALLSMLLTLVALDRAIALFDLAYIPTRGRRNDVRRIERAEFSVDVRLNALGFREPHLPSPKPPGVLRVVPSVPTTCSSRHTPWLFVGRS
jgi:hypothetical protein